MFPKENVFFWDFLTPDNEGTMFLGNVRDDSSNDTLSHPRIPESSNSNIPDIHCQC
jgi:hypothetical protein